METRNQNIFLIKENNKLYKVKVVGCDKEKNLLFLYVFNENRIITTTLHDGLPWHRRSIKKDFFEPINENSIKQKTSQTNNIVSPMSGRVIKVHVSLHEQVKQNSPLVTIESMKMENEIRAPFDLFIKTISIEEGHLVKKDQELIKIEKK